MPTRQPHLTREDICKGLEGINAYLADRGVMGEICIYGGACLCLAYKARVSTKDVDAVFEPAAIVRKAAFEVGVKMGWDWNWLNDDVKSFLSTEAEQARERLEFPELSHVKLYRPKPEYLLAMKCLSARRGDLEEPSPDLSDAVFLCRQLEITDANAIRAIVSRYYPDTALPERTEFFIVEIAANLENQ